MSQKHMDFISLAICMGLKINGKKCSAQHVLNFIHFFFLWSLEDRSWRMMKTIESKAITSSKCIYDTWHFDRWSIKNIHSESFHPENLVILLAFELIMLLKEFCKHVFVGIYCMRIRGRAMTNLFFFKEHSASIKVCNWTIWVKGRVSCLKF